MASLLVSAGPPVLVRTRARDPILRIQQLSKRYAARRGWLETLRHPRQKEYTDVLRSVSLEVARGELFGLLGPNGAGKTTVFKILSTLVIPDSGTAIVAGHDLLREAARVRSVLTPVIVDDRSLNWRISARQNLRLFGSLHGLRGPQLMERIEEVLGSVGLQNASEKMVGQFSSGMRQRLLIARALLHRPRVLLLDEPTRSLDPISARQFRSFLRDEIVGKENCTVLLATHNPEEALELCDRVAILDRGRLIAVGAPQALAETVKGDCYRAWTRTPQHPAFGALLAEGTLTSVVPVYETADSSILELRLSGGGNAASDILTSLVMRGVQISRFELTPLALADLIEHAIHAAAQDGVHA